VNGSLAVSRAFGDLSYKKAPNVKPEDQAVTALPEIKRVSLSKKGDD
jgi:protein phosphatase 2C family protein 2/3